MSDAYRELPLPPPEIFNACRRVEDWFSENVPGQSPRWEFFGICSRNHAVELRLLERKLAAAKERITALEDYAHGLEVIGDEMKQAARTPDAVKWDAKRAERPQP